MSYLQRKKKRTSLPRPVNVLYDDREKKGRWKAPSEDYVMWKQRLPVGDYTLFGWEHTVAIERKRNLKEFVMNLSGRDRKRFKAELEKLAKYKVKCIVIEDTLDMRILTKIFRTLPTRLTPMSVYYWLNKIIVDYGIPVLFIGNNTILKRQMILHLFDQIVEKIEYGLE